MCCKPVKQGFVSGVWLNCARTDLHVEPKNKKIRLTDQLGRLGECLGLISLPVASCWSFLKWFRLVRTSNHKIPICRMRVLLLLFFMSACTIVEEVLHSRDVLRRLTPIQLFGTSHLSSRTARRTRTSQEKGKNDTEGRWRKVAAWSWSNNDVICFLCLKSKSVFVAVARRDAFRRVSQHCTYWQSPYLCVDGSLAFTCITQNVLVSFGENVTTV